MPKLSCCDQCVLYAHSPFLICAVHPTGVEGNACYDFRSNPAPSDLEQWEPVGASYYNGELILSPSRTHSVVEQLELLDTHPLFTGRCPECERPMEETDPPRIHWDCEACGWKDDSL